jgi:hypothetical protein
MAEAMLYQNDVDPPFPFDVVAPKLSWLSEYLATTITTSGTPYRPANFPAMMDTILVFAKAGTSALHNTQT